MNIVSAKQTEGAVDINPMTEFREGVELLKNEYPQKALAKLRRAYECDKHNPYFMSFLGLSIARAQRKWDLASELCETAVQLKPKEIQFYLNLGEVYAASGMRERALDKLDNAMQLFGEDARLKQARSKVQNRRNPSAEPPQSHLAFFRAHAFLEPRTWQIAAPRIEVSGERWEIRSPAGFEKAGPRGPAFVVCCYRWCSGGRPPFGSLFCCLCTSRCWRSCVFCDC